MMGKKNKDKWNPALPPILSVVIPCYNSAKTIEACLASLERQKKTLPYEIIVVDSSTDQTPTLIREKFPRVKLIHLDQQVYPGAGRNIGVNKARGEIIAFIDSDCVATEDWLRKGLEAIQQGYSVVGGSVWNGNPGWISWADYFLTFNEFMPTMPWREVTFMPTCNFFITKRAFQKAGSFREDILAGEDTLFCYTVSKNYRMLFEPALQVSHSNREHFRKFIYHHQNFGKYSAYVRKHADIPGKNLVRNPALAAAAPFARTVRIGWRMLRHNLRHLPVFMASSPLLFCGTIAWSYGFIQEAWKK